MRVLTILTLSILTIGFTACGQGRKMNRTKSKTSSKVKNIEISQLSMSRTPCYGRCEIYTITIAKTGLVTFKGENNVAHEGTYTKSIPVKEAVGLINRFERFRVDTCSDRYEMMIADSPGIRYKFSIGGKEKLVENAHFGPPYLSNLAGEVDRLGKPGQTLGKEWKQVPSE